MSQASGRTLTVHERRRALRLAQLNGGLWAVGNGLATSSLVVYLAQEYGAKGIAIGLILAGPQIVGLARIWAADLVARLGDRKRFCLACYLTSNLLLVALPIVSAPGVLRSGGWSLAALVAIWTLYHLAEYFGTVAIWSWLGDLAPTRIRGRFLGRRERWLTLGRIVGMVASGLLTFYWPKIAPEIPRWVGYGLSATMGAAMMLSSLLPLAHMPSIPLVRPTRTAPSLAELAAPLGDPRFLRLLLFGCWFSLVNGLSQATQNISHKSLFAFQLFTVLALEAAMRLGQGLICPTLGRLVDRFGNRPILIVSQFVVATGPLFYYEASSAGPSRTSICWVALAWLAWIAYAGLNVGLPNLMLKLSPGGNSAPYVAAYLGVTGVVYGAATIAGGQLFDVLADGTYSLVENWIAMTNYDVVFLAGFVGRLLGVVFLVWLIEPGAWRLRDVLRRGATAGPTG